MINLSTYRTALGRRAVELQNCKKFVILPSSAGTLTPFQKEFITHHGDNYKVSYPGKNS